MIIIHYYFYHLLGKELLKSIKLAKIPVRNKRGFSLPVGIGSPVVIRQIFNDYFCVLNFLIIS